MMRVGESVAGVHWRRSGLHGPQAGRTWAKRGDGSYSFSATRSGASAKYGGGCVMFGSKALIR